MEPRFPLKDVTVREVAVTRLVETPDYADGYWQMNQNEFAMQVQEVGSFYACNGNEVEFSLCEGVSTGSAELYLNGSVYGAILHQRKILPLHGSSFIHDGKGIMVCGDTGAGKSSVTAAFVLDGAFFLTDDVTPVVIRNNEPFICALSDRIKLWDNALEQMNMEKSGLGRVAPGTEKFYYAFENANTESFPLNIVLVLNVGDHPEITFTEITGTDKAATLRNEIYRPEYMKGMKENETVYFHQILDISKSVRIFSVSRPEGGRIKKLKSVITRFITEQ